MDIIKFQIGDIVELKKPHPCGNKRFKIMRIGSDIRIICEGCGRDMVMDRLKLEKATKKLFPVAQETGGKNEQ